MPVVGLREGTTIRVDGASVTLLGDRPAIAFSAGRDPWEVAPGPVSL